MNQSPPHNASLSHVNIIRTTAMDQLLCNVLDYYECHTNYEFTCNMDVSSDIYASDAAQKQLKISSEKFEQAKCNLSSSYITFIAGLDGLEKTHHSMHGKLAATHTHTQ
jgi:hypothetical protein